MVGLRHESLERMRADGELQAGHPGDERGPPGSGGDDRAGRDRTGVGLDPRATVPIHADHVFVAQFERQLVSRLHASTKPQVRGQRQDSGPGPARDRGCCVA